MQEPEASTVAEALGRVYGRPEFQEQSLPGVLQAIRDLWEAFRGWLGNLILTGLEAMGGLTPFLAPLLMVVLSVALLAGVAALLFALGNRPGARAGRRDSAPAPPPSDAAAWEAQARRARAEGRLREAALALYQAVLLRLEERGVLRVHEGKTPGDYRREVRSDPAAFGIFDGFVRVLLPVAFAAQSPDPATFDALWRAAGGVGIDA